MGSITSEDKGNVLVSKTRYEAFKLILIHIETLFGSQNGTENQPIIVQLTFAYFFVFQRTKKRCLSVKICANCKEKFLNKYLNARAC